MPPPGFTDLRSLSGLAFDIGYHREDNFTGARVVGYEAPGAWLIDEAAARLACVIEDLRSERAGLIVYDAYRPLRACAAMVAWCEAHDPRLLDGFIARDSRHARGIAIDVGLVHLESGGVLPMGTAWDAFDDAASFANAIGAARVNRRLLREAMMKHGFAPYDREWWHFELRIEPMPPSIDVAYDR